MELVFGGDSSTWQDSPEVPGHPDFQKAYDNGWRFNYIKATQGDFVDADYKTSWLLCRATPLKLGVYHFLQWNIDPVLQANLFWNTVKNDPGELPIICDFEWWSTVPSNALDILRRFLEELKRICGGHRIGIYTAEGFWVQYGSKDIYWSQYDLWTAHYNDTPPTPYAPWTEWFMWQFTGNGDGHYYGMESAGVDLDYANGDWWDKYIGNTGDNMTDYSQNAIGYFTKAAGWTNPAFDFIVGYAGGDWSKRTDGTWVQEPNQYLKPIELQARTEKKAFFVVWDFDVSYYADAQYMADDQHWPPPEADYCLKAMINALAPRDFDGLIIRMMDRNNAFYVKKEAMNYVSYAANKFVDRANKWLYTTKGLKKQTLLLTYDPWIKQDDRTNPGTSEYFYAWIKPEFPPVVTEQPAVTLVSSYPAGTEIPKGIADTTWRMWYYYWSGRTNNFLTEPELINRTYGLMIYNGNHKDLYDWLQISEAPPPVVDTSAPTAPTNLQAVLTGSSVRLTWVASSDNVGVAGYKLFRNGVEFGYTNGVLYTDATVLWNSTVSYSVKALDSAGNVSVPTTVQIILPVDPNAPPPSVDNLTQAEFDTWEQTQFVPLEDSVTKLRADLDSLEKDLDNLKSLLSQWCNT